MNFLKKKYVYAVIFSICLIICNLYVLLKTFVLPTVIGNVTTEESVEDSKSINSIKEEENKIIITDNTYQDDNISISIDTIYEYNTYIYIADIQISSINYLKTAIAQNVFGTNITEKTSIIAAKNNAILAINGDYYGANSKGYVIKNGVIYRSSIRTDTKYDDLVIYKDGSFKIINEQNLSTEELISGGVINLFAFGPTLVNSAEITISKDEEVSKAMSDNPRTAIGITDDNHYIFMVSDGRTNESDGLSLYEVASIMKNYKCIIAYNLDGGGSSTLYFNGKVINNPTTNGKTIKERAVSDIVYIGY